MKNLKGIDSRQVPKVKSICADKKYFDILYSYLQTNSTWDGVQGNPRYIDKSVINFSAIGRDLGLTRQTVAKKFSNLLSLDLVQEDEENGGYILPVLPNSIAALIPLETLSMLITTLHENTVSAYIYLLLRYVASQEKSFYFTLKDIKQHIGICATTRSNDFIVTNILAVLQKLGLIKYVIETETAEGETKTWYKITYVTNFIEC